MSRNNPSRRVSRPGGGGSHRRTCLCFAFPCCAGKYREILALEAGYGGAALALANKFKSFPPDSLTFGTGNFAERTANCTYRNKESFLRLAKGVGTKLTYRGAELATDSDPFRTLRLEARPWPRVSLERRCLSPRLKRTRRGDIVFGRSGGVGPLREAPRQSLLVA